MSLAEHSAHPADAPFHPQSHHASPGDVLRDSKLSVAEKRLILSSWASDMYAVESRPALRKIPGVAKPICVDDILAALRQLDDRDDPPPRGAAAMRPPRYSTLDARSAPQGSGTAIRLSATGTLKASPSRRSHTRCTPEDYVRRYRRLLTSHLTEVERQFVQRRLAEEMQALAHAR